MKSNGELFFISLILLGAAFSGLGVAFLAPVFALLLPLLTIPVFAFGWIRYRRERAARAPAQANGVKGVARAEDFKDGGALTLGSKSAERSRMEVEPNLKEILLSETRLKNVSSLAQAQIQEINTRDLPKLLESLPADGSVHQDYNVLNGVEWVFQFHFKSVAAEFHAVGLGRTPRAAFEMAKGVVLMQVREWHRARAKNQPYVGQMNDLTQLSVREQSAIFSLKSINYAGRKPTVLIVEDDLDMAEQTAAVFRKLGCNTLISNGRDGAPQKMSFDNVDFIVLDWVLGQDLYGDQLLNRSERIINAFRDLQNRFKVKSAKIITFSAMNRTDIQVPASRYFEHVDHWQKPVPMKDLERRAERLLNANGF